MVAFCSCNGCVPLYNRAMPQFLLNGTSFPCDITPSECPRCHKSIAAIPQSGGVSMKIDGTDVAQAIFQCPACQEIFMCTYIYEGRRYHLTKVEPQCPIEQSFGTVDAISPQFVKIYNQAYAAESAGLNEIAGLGYRKSLEFLIKDYAISLTPDDAEAIKASFLAPS
jgi:hypothetical protein